MRLVKGNKSIAWLFALLFVVVNGLSSYGQNIPERPSPPRLVNDFAAMLQPSERDELEQKLVAYADSTSTQIAIVTVVSLDGAPVQEYAAQLGYKWGVGTKENHNGVVILIAKEDRKGYIATGYGVEDGLNSQRCKEIYDNIVVPNLKASNTYRAFDESTDAMFAILAGKFVNTTSGDTSEPIPLAFVFIFILFIFLFVLFASKNAKQTQISRRGYFDQSPWIGGGGGWGGGGSSSGGGGFGGFGGGDFSGGGAGGDW
jgi:uncharacterized protein